VRVLSAFKYKSEHLPLFRYIEGLLYSTYECHAYVFLTLLIANNLCSEIHMLLAYASVYCIKHLNYVMNVMKHDMLCRLLICFSKYKILLAQT